MTKVTFSDDESEDVESDEDDDEDDEDEDDDDEDDEDDLEIDESDSDDEDDGTTQTAQSKAQSTDQPVRTTASLDPSVRGKKPKDAVPHLTRKIETHENSRSRPPTQPQKQPREQQKQLQQQEIEQQQRKRLSKDLKYLCTKPGLSKRFESCPNLLDSSAFVKSGTKKVRPEHLAPLVISNKTERVKETSPTKRVEALPRVDPDANVSNTVSKIKEADTVC